MAKVSYDEEAEEPESDDEYDEEMEREMERMAKLAKGRGVRGTVSAEVYKENASWTAPVHVKEPDQREQITAAVMRSFIFQGLARDKLEQVIDAFEGPQSVEMGMEIIHQGDMVDSEDKALYCIESGLFDVYKSSKLVFTYTEPGSMFGELALLYNCPRAATVVAKSDGVIWSIERETFNQLVKGGIAAQKRKYQNFLADVDLLSGLNEDERAKIADVLQSREFSDGDRIVRAGDEGHEFFFLDEGCAKAMVDGKVVKEYGHGNYFGELALLNRAVRAADVVAGATPTRCAVLDEGAFRRLLGPLDNLLRERAKAYENVNLPAAAAAETKKKLAIVEKKSDWLCEGRRCGFWNFDRNVSCMHCGKPRPTKPTPPLPKLRALNLHETSITSKLVDILGIENESPDVFVARYVRRQTGTGVGFVQSKYHVAPGESFSVTVRALGTFGEIAIGFAPKGNLPSILHKVTKKHHPPQRDAFKNCLDPAATGISMVGWSQHEVGCHGDHGRWYQNGSVPGHQVSPRWEEGDVLDLGIGDDGAAILKRNGACIYEMDGPWPGCYAYPTVTVRSGGAEATIDISRVTQKPDPSPRTPLSKPRTGLLAAMRRTMSPLPFAEATGWARLLNGQCWCCGPEQSSGKLGRSNSVASGPVR